MDCDPPRNAVLRALGRAGAIAVLLLTVIAGRSSATLSAAAAPQATYKLWLPAVLNGKYDWLQFNGDAQHSGNNPQETALNAGNVSGLRRLFLTSLPAPADGAAVYLSAAATPSGPRDLLFLTTKAGHIIAVDARTGAQVWTHQYGAGSCTTPSTDACFTTSSPAIDPNRQYVYSYGLDGYVHKYQVGDGTEIMGGGWPELTTLKRDVEKGSSDLTVLTTAGGASYLYVTHASYPGNLGDFGDYQGHITTINLADGSQRVFNALCSDQTVHFVKAPGAPDCADVRAGIWARGGVSYLPATNRIYVSTGNGMMDQVLHNWGDTTFALRPDGTGVNGGPVDSYTPANYQWLQASDEDLGSTSPTILPVPASTMYPHLAVQGGKDFQLRLLNLDNLSGQGGPGHTGGEVSVTSLAQQGEILTAPAAWRNPADNSIWVFVADLSGISGLQLTQGPGGVPTLTTRWLYWTSSMGGTSPLIANNVLYYVGSKAGLRALNPTTGTTLWADSTIGAIHWESPIVANGAVYVTNEQSQLIAYSLP